MRRMAKLAKRIRNRLSSYINLIRFYAYGVKHGKHCVVHGKLYLNLFDSASLTIGDNFYCSSGMCVNALSTNKRGCIYATDQARITIGNNVGMSSPVLWSHKEIIIGDYVKIGANSILIDTDAHNLNYIVRRGQWTDWGISRPIVIDDDVFIGANCIILKGCHIGARSIVAAGSVVTTSFPPDSIIGGNPAKILKVIGGIPQNKKC